ncbi:MAG TPA: SEC-C metal-binding domain-containing protein, partial [Anaerolineae bacterium]
QDSNRVRAADMETIVKRLFLRDEDVARLAKKMEVNADPFTTGNLQMLGEMFMVEDATVLSDILHLGIPHNVLNAKEHEKEGGIIARAGELHAITLATNMAGRGVDIKLGGELPEQTLNEVGRVLRKNGVDPYDLTFDQIKDALQKVPAESYELDKEPVETFLKYMNDRAKVRELGGLRIIGTERHEARRIDNQLSGRSGRQGDQGSSRFYVSLEDEIMRRMGGKGLVDRVWVEDIPIEHSWVTGAIEQAQVKMESYNFDIRKHLLEYDDVLNKQREVIYGQRYRILTKADLREDLRGWLEEELGRVIAEDLKADHGESRLLLHLDSLLPGFFMNENELWPPFSLELVKRSIEKGGNGVAKAHGANGHTADLDGLKEKILDAAQEAMELNRNYLSESIIPEIVSTFEQQYRTTWDEIEDLARNTLKTIQEEAGEQNRRLDARTITTAIGQSVGMSLEVRAERAGEIGDREVLDAVRRAYDMRVADQVYHRTAKRAGLEFEFHWRPEGELDFGALREELATAIDEAYTKIAEKHLVEIERELDERVKSLDDLHDRHLANLLFGISNTRQAAFDQRTHRRIDLLVPRFPWVHLAAIQLKQFDNDALHAEILSYWNQSLQALEPLRGNAAGFNDLLRELMLSVVTNLWVDYLTAIESLREGIGLQAFGQRDPLVEYKRRAYEMFQDLYARIRSQVVSFVFTYQYRGFAKLEEEDRDRAARQVVEAAASTPAIASRSTVIAEAKTNGGNGTEKSNSSKQKAEGKKPDPPRKPIGAPVGTKLGRNDPCWCGSGKKYKNCHMQSDMK